MSGAVSGGFPGQHAAVAHVEVACLEGAFRSRRRAAVDGVETVDAAIWLGCRYGETALFKSGCVISTEGHEITLIRTHKAACRMAVFLPVVVRYAHSGVEAVALFCLAAGDGFRVGIFRRGHADDGERHLMLHLEAELGAVGAVGAVGHRAERHHQVAGGVGGVGALVAGGPPGADKGGEKLPEGPGCSDWVFKYLSDDLSVHILVLLPGIIGVVVRPAAVRRAFGGELRALRQRPGGAVVGEAEVEVFVGDSVDGGAIALLPLRHLVEPYLVPCGELGGVTPLHGAGGRGGVIFIVRRRRRGVCSVGHGDGERRGGRDGRFAGPRHEAVIGGAGAHQHHQHHGQQQRGGVVVRVIVSFLHRSVRF